MRSQANPNHQNLLTGDSREHQGFWPLFLQVQFCNFCAICPLEMRFVALDSSSQIMEFRTKQRSKPTCRTPSARREEGGQRGKITGGNVREGPRIPLFLSWKMKGVGPNIFDHVGIQGGNQKKTYRYSNFSDTTLSPPSPPPFPPVRKTGGASGTLHFCPDPLSE